MPLSYQSTTVNCKSGYGVLKYIEGEKKRFYHEVSTHVPLVIVHVFTLFPFIENYAKLSRCFLSDMM